MRLFDRRRLIAVIASFCAFAGAASAQAPYPSKPVRIIVPYTAGGSADFMARMIAQRLTEVWKDQVLVENRGGAGGHVGGEQVAKAAPDGHTLVLATIAHNGASAMFRGLKYNPGTDLVPVVLVAESAGVLIVHPSLPVKTVAEFIALAKAQPGRLNYASAGNGSAIHMATELFKHLTGTDLTHVPYKGSAPAMTDLIGGQVQLMFENIATAHPFIKDGRVRAIAVTGRQRNASLPDLPTIAEAGVPGYAAEPWYTVSAPKGVPPEVMRRLNADLNTVLKAPDLAQRWESLGVTPLGGSLADALQRNAAETERWSRVIKAAQISVDG